MEDVAIAATSFHYLYTVYHTSFNNYLLTSEEINNFVAEVINNNEMLC